MSELQTATFSYDRLDPETRIVVQQRTSEILTIMRRTAQDVIDLGGKLLDVKNRLDHGQFGEWLRAEFGWSEDTALRFMQTYKAFYQKPHIAEFAPSALYALSAPSTPEEARQEALKRAESGEKITHRAAKEIVAKHKPEPEKLERLVENYLSIWCRSPQEKVDRLEAILSGGAENKWNELSNYVRNVMPVSSERLLEAVRMAKARWEAPARTPAVAPESARSAKPQEAEPGTRATPAEPTHPAPTPQPPTLQGTPPSVTLRGKETATSLRSSAGAEVHDLLQALYDLGVDELAEALRGKANEDGSLAKLYDIVAAMLRRARERVNRGIGA
jgi:hypothetical protein